MLRHQKHADIFRTSKWLRRKQYIRRFGVVMLLFMGVSGSAFLLLFSSLFSLKHVAVEGAAALVPAALEARVWQIASQERVWPSSSANLLLLSSEKVAYVLKESFPRIGEILVKKRYPGRLTISIQERSLDVIWCAKEADGPDGAPEARVSEQNARTRCFYIDNFGVIFQDAPELVGNGLFRMMDERPEFREVRPERNVLNNELLDALAAFRASLSGVGAPAGSVYIKTDAIIEFVTREGWRVIVNLRTDPKNAAANLRLALEREIKEKRHLLDYMDLRFGDKLYYAFRKK